MGVDLLTEDTDYLLSTMGANDPAKQITPNWYFSGSGDAFVKGAVGGLAAVERTGLDALNAAQFYDQMLPGDTPFLTPMTRAMGVFGEAYKQGAGISFDDQLKATEEWAKLDPRTMGGGARIVGSLTRGVTIFGLGTLMGGPVAGAGTLGATEGYQTFRDLRGEGVDEDTALTAAGVVAATSFAGAFIPASLTTKSLLYAAGSGAALNTGFGMASRGAVSAVLDANGYGQMADQYRALDAEAIAADIIIGAAFGGMSRFGAKPGEAPPKPTTDELLDAMEVRRQAENARGTAGIPIDAATAKLDAELSDRALASILTGKPVDIDGSEATRIVENSLLDPQRMEIQRTYEDAYREEYGPFLDMPEMLPDEPAVAAPRPIVDEAAPVAPVAALPDFDPVVASQIDHLAMQSPDLDIVMYDGTTVKAANLKQKIAETMQTAEKESNLFNVAVACFLRTGG